MGVNFLQGKEISCNSWLQGFGCLNIFIGTGRLTAIQSSWPLFGENKPVQAAVRACCYYPGGGKLLGDAALAPWALVQPSEWLWSAWTLTDMVMKQMWALPSPNPASPSTQQLEIQTWSLQSMFPGWALRNVPSMHEECVSAGKHKILKSINMEIDHVREKLWSPMCNFLICRCQLS